VAARATGAVERARAVVLKVAAMAAGEAKVMAAGGLGWGEGVRVRVVVAAARARAS
jgi:hypothetical protein